jgi:hypothetical protein
MKTKLKFEVANVVDMKGIRIPKRREHENVSQQLSRFPVEALANS